MCHISSVSFFGSCQLGNLVRHSIFFNNSYLYAYIYSTNSLERKIVQMALTQGPRTFLFYAWRSRLRFYLVVCSLEHGKRYISR